MRIWCLLLLALVAALGSNPGVAGAQKPVRVLMILVGSTGADSAHNIVTNPPHLEKAFAAAGGIELTRLQPEPGQGGGAHLAKLAALKPGDHDVLLFYTVGQDLTPEQEGALRGFVEAGGGIVALHGASASFGKSDTWFRMIGARFAGHAPGTYRLPIAVADAQHPIMKGVSEFEIEDEEYCHRFPEGVERRVVARFKQRPPNTSEKNGNNDAVWTVQVGKGRVVYNALGHGDAAWRNPAWQRIVVQSVLWAAGRPGGTSSF